MKKQQLIEMIRKVIREEQFKFGKFGSNTSLDNLAFELLDFAGGELEDSYDWKNIYKTFFEERGIDPKSREAETIYNTALSNQENP